MEITKGKQIKPLKVVVYGPEGIGKSTFASKFPNPVFIDCEGGTNQLDVDRVRVTNFSEFEQAMKLIMNSKQYQTLIIDTADWLEKMIVQTLCSESGKTGIEDFGYGKGYTFLAEKLSSLLDRLTRFQSSTGMNIVFTAHAMTRKFDLPEESGSFDRWEMKLEKKCSPMLKEWADLLLFANYKHFVVKDKDPMVKNKVTGGERVMYTSHHSCYDAKNRFGLPAELPFDFTKIAHIVSSSTPPVSVPVPPPVPAKEPPADPALSAVPEPEQSLPETLPKETHKSSDYDPEKESLIYDLIKLAQNDGISKEEVMAEVAKNGVCPAGTPIESYNTATLKRIIAGWARISTNIISNRK